MHSYATQDISIVSAQYTSNVQITNSMSQCAMCTARLFPKYYILNAVSSLYESSHLQRKQNTNAKRHSTYLGNKASAMHELRLLTTSPSVTAAAAAAA